MMKKFLPSILAGTGLATAAFAQPQPAPSSSPRPVAAQQAATPAVPAAPACRRRIDASPAMWQVRDEDTIIYLFGTFHLLDACRDWFHGAVRTAFDRSDELVVEAILPDNPAEAQPTIMRLATDPQGRSISSRLSGEEAAKLREQLGALYEPFDQAKIEPWFIGMTLSNIGSQRLNLDQELGPEAVLRRQAAGRRMQVHALETVEFQLRMSDTQPEAAQLAALRRLIADPGSVVRTQRPMLDAWSRGDLKRLAAIMEEGFKDHPQSRRVLLIDRNAAWARWIQERLKRPGTVFMAVGGGHLGGVGSVQDQLRWLGIESSRVRSVPRR